MQNISDLICVIKHKSQLGHPKEYVPHITWLLWWHHWSHWLLFLGGWENKPFGANLTAFLIWLLSLVIYCLQISYQALCLIWPWWQCSLFLLSIVCCIITTGPPYCICILCNMLHMCQRVFLNIWTIFEDLAFTAIHFPYPGSTLYLKKRSNVL